MPDSELRRRLYQLPYLAYRRQLWQRASLFLCVSQYIREKAIRAGFPEEKIRVQYTGMNYSAFAPTLPVGEKDPNLVLYVGRLVPYKGCDYLLRAMKLVQRRRPEARLVVIGEGFFRTELERLNGELGVGERNFLESCRIRQSARGWNEPAFFVLPASPLKTA